MDEHYVMALAIGGLVIVIYFANLIRERYNDHKREEAWQYLLDSLRGLYFYGQPLAKCIQQRVVWKLWQKGNGDFAIPVGELISYGLHQQGNDSARVCWQEKPENPLDDTYYIAQVVFNYENRDWLFNVRAQYIDQVSFRRTKLKENRGYAMRGYRDMDRGRRCVLENCTDPTRSNLSPRSRNRDYERYADFERTVKETVESIVEEGW